MPLFYVNKNEDNRGDHEVHEWNANCPKYPHESNLIYLGNFPDCTSAVKKAQQLYPTANGCYFCARKCHTS